jgi:hypothetical protein
MKPILCVNTVDLKLLKSFPPQLVITAYGKVSSGGWKDGTLAPRFHVVPPADGIIDYDFIAEPPTGIAIQVILPIVAHTTFTDPPSWLKGVRVHSASNAVVAAFDQKMPGIDLALPAAANGVQLRKVNLSMRLDADVSFYETAVWLEGRYVDGWTWDAQNAAYVRAYTQFPIAGMLDVRAQANSINEPDISSAVMLGISVEDGTPNVLRVDTHDFQGRAEGSYHV